MGHQFLTDGDYDVRGGKYDESVQVQLYKSGAGGSESLVNTKTLNVPAAHGGKTVSFDFSAAFTGADASIGKVTFRAVAVLLSGRDALPADNQAIAPPTDVRS